MSDVPSGSRLSGRKRRAAGGAAGGRRVTARSGRQPVQRNVQPPLVGPLSPLLSLLADPSTVSSVSGRRVGDDFFPWTRENRRRRLLHRRPWLFGDVPFLVVRLRCGWWPRFLLVSLLGFLSW